MFSLFSFVFIVSVGSPLTTTTQVCGRAVRFWKCMALMGRPLLCRILVGAIVGQVGYFYCVTDSRNRGSAKHSHSECERVSSLTFSGAVSV